MKTHDFRITDRHGNPYHVVAVDFKTKRGRIATLFNLLPLGRYTAPPLLYVRYPIAYPGTGSVYWEYNPRTCEAIERVSIRQFFPSWDMRTICKEWRCLNG